MIGPSTQPHATSSGYPASPSLPSNFPRSDDRIKLKDGRYFAGGYGFSTAQQAEHFLRRMDSARPPAPFLASGSSIAMPPPRETGRSRELREVEPGIWEDADGRYHAAGFAFSTLAQARDHAARHWRQRDTKADIAQAEKLPTSVGVSPFKGVPGQMPKAERGPERWIGATTLLQVNGIAFEAVLTYFGVPKDKWSHPRNNSLVDPSLSVASQADPGGATLGYWPCYADLDPRARRSYLLWLASGRCDPTTPIGYVFIYFYGLERRLVYDRAHGEADVILSEVRRLLAIYGRNPSFARYANALLEFGNVILDVPPAPLIPTLDRPYGYEVPLGVRLALGQSLLGNQALVANECLCWILSLPDTYLRTPARRCFDELVALWHMRFDQAYPGGLTVRAPKARIAVNFRPASGGYHADATVDAPDITHVQGPIPRLRELLLACSDELDALSRYLGKLPNARGSLEAAVLLPRDLRTTQFGAGAMACLDRLEQLLGDACRTTLTSAELFAQVGLEPTAESALPAAAARQLAGMLDAVDIGFEPDKRYGVCGPIGPETHICIFKAEGGGPVSPEAEHYVSARALTEIAALAATADGVVVPLEVEAIRQDLESLQLSETERARLLAHAEAFLRNPPKARAAIKRLVALSEDRRRRICQSAISAVLADGHVLPSEVRFLEGLYKALGFASEDIYTQLHRGSVEFDEPVTVARAVKDTGVALPAEVANASSVMVDAGRLERIRRETSEVSSLLATIFVDEGVTPALTTAVRSAGAGRFAGLDEPHGDLLAHLLATPMERPEFEEAARARKLLPHGALETINDWSFEKFDEPAIEDDDMILVAAHLLAPISALEKAA
jgi:uncharacterized membrane protein YebE (DUF533 family)